MNALKFAFFSFAVLFLFSDLELKTNHFTTREGLVIVTGN